MSVVLLVLVWILFQPPFASVDEAAHASRAFSSVNGTLFFPPNHGAPAGEVENVAAPKWILPTDENESPYCFWTKRDVTANCAADNWDDSTIVERPNATAQYFPTYYIIAGLPSLVFDGELGYYSMRFFGALLFLGILGIAYFVMYRYFNSFVLPCVMLCLTPITFLGAGTLTPNPVEVVSAFTLAIVLFVFFHLEIYDRGLMGLLFVVQFILLTARPSGLIWSTIIWLSYIFMYYPKFKQSEKEIRFFAIPVVLSQHLLSIGYLFFHRPKVSYNVWVENYDIPYALSFGIQSIYEQFRGLIGIIGMDVYLPEVAYLISLSIFGYFTFRYFFDENVEINLRDRFTAGMLLCIVVSVATLADYYYRNVFSHMWQGRYTAPIYAVLLLLLVVAVKRSSAPLFASVLMTFINVGGVFYAFLRYSVGFTGGQCCGTYALSGSGFKWLPFGFGPVHLLVLLLTILVLSISGLKLAKGKY